MNDAFSFFSERHLPAWTGGLRSSPVDGRNLVTLPWKRCPSLSFISRLACAPRQTGFKNTFDFVSGSERRAGAIPAQPGGAWNNSN